MVVICGVSLSGSEVISLIGPGIYGKTLLLCKRSQQIHYATECLYIRVDDIICMFYTNLPGIVISSGGPQGSAPLRKNVTSPRNTKLELELSWWGNSRLK